MAEEMFPWLKSLPLAPEYHPTPIEFEDPIAYIFKIEEKASRYGICKIVPPCSVSSTKAIIANLNRTLSSHNPDSSPTFTTRAQQIGFCPQENQHPVQRSIWLSGMNYTLPEFKLKAMRFKNNMLKKVLDMKRDLTPLELETLYWKAQFDEQITVEYANDMLGSMFDETGQKQGKKQGKKQVSDSRWNARMVARANGSLLKFLKEEIPGVTSPMIYIGMLYSWFAWHIEDHDLHSVNYMHMGAAKTWYGVPMEAALAFEEVVRTHAYEGQISPSVTFATLAGKTTVMSPEELVKAGVPCCRLVQNAGEFVVTFPRAYHSGFSHGFNCAEAVNFATPGWLKVAREAAIRRLSIDIAPMFSYSQLMYDLALSLSSSEQKCSRPEPQSTRLKDRIKHKGDEDVKHLFMQDVIRNNELLNALGNGSPITLLSEDVLKSLVFHGFNKKADPAMIFSCITCGSPCYSCVTIVQPSEEAAHYFMANEDEDVLDPGLSSNVPFTNRKPSLMRCGPRTPACERDFSRMHVFCLEHAREVQQRLRLVGGVCILLLCRQDYHEINDAARSMGKELGISDDVWTDVGYIDVTKQDKAIIQQALDDEESVTSNKDWAVKSGIDIFYSAKLCASSSHKKQMPYNSVIYKAFGQYSPSNDMMTPNQSGRKKKITVAGRWCGKVWMSNQVHPLLVVRDHDIQEEDHEKSFLFPMMKARHEQLVVRINPRKRKRPVEGKFDEVEASPLPQPQARPRYVLLPLPAVPFSSPLLKGAF